MTQDFLKVALTIAEQRGWMSIPLINDPQGRPKRPITNDWPNLTLAEETIRSLPWEQALGIGIVLGPVSGNLAVIDIDNQGLAAHMLPLLDTRCVRTGRLNGHIYVKEYLPSEPTNFQVLWEGAHVGIELKSRGQQVAAPPTPGYILFNQSPPMLVNRVEDAWQTLVKQTPGLTVTHSANGNHYPRPWQQTVSITERNKSAYVEAHRLRESGMPIEQAMDYMHIRWQKDYAPGEQEWREIERTIESAYSAARYRKQFSVIHLPEIPNAS